MIFLWELLNCSVICPVSNLHLINNHFFSVFFPDISLIEHFDHAPKENVNTVQELARLEKLDNEIDNEIQELELVSWEGKLELELEKQTRLQSEIKTMRISLSKCKTELEKVNSKIKVRIYTDS